jgi:hypothetical protein
MGGPQIPQQNLGQELGQTFGAFKSQELPAFQNFVSGQPILEGQQQNYLQSLQPFLQQYVQPILASGGALTHEQEGDVRRQTGALFAETGQLHGNQYVGQELLNRQAFQQQRVQQALQESGQVQQQGLGTEAAETGNFMALLAPLLNFGSDVFSSNQNAAAAQSIAGGNKASGGLSAGVGLIGAAATAY